MDVLYHMSQIKGIVIYGNVDMPEIDSFAPIETALPHQASWVRGIDKSAIEKVVNSAAGVIFCNNDFPVDQTPNAERVYVLCDNPRLRFAQYVRMKQQSEQKWDIHPSAVIDEEALLPERIAVGPNVVIGKAIIGEDCIIQANCVIHDNVTLGKRVFVHNHCCVGSDGFSFERTQSGTVEKFPHIGACEIGDDVEIYPFANIDRGTLGVVRVGDGTKIDHHVHIAHNCSVGRNCLITAGVILAGGVQVGDNVWLGVGTTVKEKKHIGNNCFIGINSTITKNVPDGEFWVGSPARFVRKL